MADILQDFPVVAPLERVFAAVATPAGLDAWWTERSAGRPAEAAEYALGFGPGVRWRARVTRCAPPNEFELELTSAVEDWSGTRVGFLLAGRAGGTHVRFHHTGWPEANEHYRISCHCWALYLRLLRRHLEHGETVAYADRLDA